MLVLLGYLPRVVTFERERDDAARRNHEQTVAIQRRTAWEQLERRAAQEPLWLDRRGGERAHCARSRPPAFSPAQTAAQTSRRSLRSPPIAEVWRGPQIVERFFRGVLPEEATKYKLLSHVGRGAYGEVWAARPSVRVPEGLLYPRACREE